MLSLEEHIDQLLTLRLDKTQLASQLGFFSKPVKVVAIEGEFVIKLYQPVKNKKIWELIINNHDVYVDAMRGTGIHIPATRLLQRKNQDKNWLIIVQEALPEESMVRSQLEKATLPEIKNMLGLLLDDTLLFWKNKPKQIHIGFHPTLRNYAWLNQSLIYFDTFPPMLMPQPELNKVILAMTPAKINIKWMIPLGWINRVSDEYYFIDKMVTGIIGSTCRLRPEFYPEILEFSRQYITSSTQLTAHEKQAIHTLLKKPPRLSGLWTGMRKLFGKTGKPNVKN